MTVLVVSPHLDDAVFSAGQFLAGRPESVVVTVFAGAPQPPQRKPWDVECGFAGSWDAARVRRAEDDAALATLSARPVHLDFLDNQYEPIENSAALVRAVVDQVERHRPEFVVGPLGVRHPDHKRTRRAVLEASWHFDVPVWLYGDLPYMTDDEWLRTAFSEVSYAGYGLEPDALGGGSAEVKRAAVQQYASQLKAFDVDNTVMVPERFWKVSDLRYDDTAEGLRLRQG